MKNGPFLKAGLIVAPHGLHGALKVKILTESSASFLNYVFFCNQKGDVFDVQSGRILNHNHVIVTLKGVDSRTQAEAIVGETLLIQKDQRGQLDTDEFYHDDLIGLSLVDESGHLYGTVVHIDNYGSCDILFAKSNDQTEWSIPFIKEAVKEIDLTKGVVIINPHMIVR